MKQWRSPAFPQTRLPSTRNRLGSLAISRGRFLGLTAVAAAAVVTRADSAKAGSPLQVRRNAKSLSADEKARFVNAVKQTKQLPSLYSPKLSTYDYYVRLHYAAYYDPDMPAHMAAAFGPWHRQLLLMFSRDLQRTDPSVTVPCWGWTVDNSPESYIWRT